MPCRAFLQAEAGLARKLKRRAAVVRVVEILPQAGKG
jgi:hypothetical protein